jgi:hypothetical protein
VLQIFVVNGEVGCEHGRGEFAAIRAIADEGVDQARAFDWLVAVLEQRRQMSLVERKEESQPMARSLVQDSGARLTNASCTAPQRQVAVASPSLYPRSLAREFRGM